MEKAGISQSELARRVGITQASVNKLLSGTAYGSRHLHKIARELGTSPAYLNGETDDSATGAVPLPTSAAMIEYLDLVPIRSINLEYGLGATFVDDHVDVEVQHFPRAWVQSFTHTPSDQLTFARGRGDSMYPTIHSHDMVMIDLSQKRIEEPDAIWAYTNGMTGGIKRLRLQGDQVIVLSDNPAVREYQVPADEVNIVGRVIMILRSV